MSPSALAGLPGPLAIAVKLEGLHMGFAFLGLRGDQLKSGEVVSESFECVGTGAGSGMSGGLCLSQGKGEAKVGDLILSIVRGH